MYKLFIYFIIFYTSLLGERITKIAKEYLSKDTLVLYGKSVSSTGIRSGVLVTFAIDSVHWGKVSSQKINIIYPYIKAPSVLDTSEKLVFVEPMAAGRNYKSLQEFSSLDKFFPQKLQSLDKLLAIEKLPKKLAIDQHFSLCIDQLKSDTSWQRWNGFWEWQHIVNTRSKQITLEKLQGIILTYPLIPELSLKKRLRETIIRVKRKLGTTTIEEEKLKAHPASMDKALEDLKSEDLQKQIEAIHTIGQYHTQTSGDILRKNLQHSSHHMRNICLFYLKLQGTANDIPFVLSILKNDPSLRVRKNAINVLGKLGAIEAIPEITKYLTIDYTKYTAEKNLDLLRPLVK
ncbi:HEAT repeat domain-containing protein [Candidatus Uabimicrobium sp. HlEnr_7]|uniref:HEAT repeat domain-containing protein n=1 Tax=Candidatus Uabimicrobium helgolandensis TaxID=3095367 RepID=UPI0035572CEA